MSARRLRLVVGPRVYKEGFQQRRGVGRGGGSSEDWGFVAVTDCVIMVSQGNRVLGNRPGLDVAKLPTPHWFQATQTLGSFRGCTWA